MSQPQRQGSRVTARLIAAIQRKNAIIERLERNVAALCRTIKELKNKKRNEK